MDEYDPKMLWLKECKPKRWKIFLVLIIFVLCFICYFFGRICNFGVCTLTTNDLSPPKNDTLTLPTGVLHYRVTQALSKLRRKPVRPTTSYDSHSDHSKFSTIDLLRRFDVDFVKRDVIVFLHMQKTGGTTLGRKMTRHLDIPTPCQCTKNKKKCDCFSTKNNVWLFSRYSTGWICGLHADWTELTACVADAMDGLEQTNRDRRYLYITILRDPVKRYISEWKHVRRGATWRGAYLKCNNHLPSLEQIPFCYEGDDWRDVMLDEFMDCEHNLATNRQTRMLADLTKVDCYNTTTMDPDIRDRIIVESAKDNLRKMAYFGILEYMNYTQMLFEDTFNIRFSEDFVQYEKTHITGTQIAPDQYQRVTYLNRLDIELYEYAKQLFLERVNFMRTLPKRTPKERLLNTKNESYEFTQTYRNEESDKNGDSNRNTDSDSNGNSDPNMNSESDPNGRPDSVVKKPSSTNSNKLSTLKDFQDLLHINGDPFAY